MSEADAEDGLHGLDANHSDMNEGTTLDLHFIPTASCFFTGSPPRLFATPFQIQIPPAKK
jgi:hypothetical protein